MAEIPENVLDALAEVRASGETNMLMSETVIALVLDLDGEAGLWLYEHPDDYMIALRAMGARRASAEA